MTRHYIFRIKKLILEATAVLMAAVVLFEMPYSVYADKISELEAKIEAAKEEKIATEKALKRNRDELGTLNETQGTLEATLESLTRELELIGDNLNIIENSIVSGNKSIKDMEEELAEAENIRKKQYEDMKVRIQYMYETRSMDEAEALAGRNSFGLSLNKPEYIQSVARFDRNMLEEYQKTCEVIAEGQRFLDDEVNALVALRDDAVSEQARVNELIDRTHKSIRKYREIIEATEKALENQEKALSETIDDIEMLQKQLEAERGISKIASASEKRDISQVSFADGDRKLLANIIYCEAGNQSYEGQLAVGAVVMNRVLSSVFPDTIVGVVYQKGQFTPAGSGRLALALANDLANETCYAAADAAMAGANNVGNCLYFRTPIAGLNGLRIEGHVFY